MTEIKNTLAFQPQSSINDWDIHKHMVARSIKLYGISNVVGNLAEQIEELKNGDDDCRHLDLIFSTNILQLVERAVDLPYNEIFSKRQQRKGNIRELIEKLEELEGEL